MIVQNTEVINRLQIQVCTHTVSTEKHINQDSHWTTIGGLAYSKTKCIKNRKKLFCAIPKKFIGNFYLSSVVCSSQDSPNHGKLHINMEMDIDVDTNL